MLSQRLATAAVGIPIIIAVTLIGGVLFAAVAVVILVIAAAEFARMLDGEVAERQLWEPSPIMLVAIIGVAGVAIGADAGFEYWTGALALSVGLAFLYTMALSEIEESAADWLTISGTVLYVGFLGSHLIIMRDDLHDGEEWLLLAVLATWIADTVAYAAGKQFGENKMAPRISPGKTWEGTAAGFAGGLIAVPVLDIILDLPLSAVESVLLGVLLSVVAVLADLGESMLKRGAGVKDTSELVPGHGGFLDRLDSILFTVPLVFYFAVWIVL